MSQFQEQSIKYFCFSSLRWLAANVASASVAVALHQPYFNCVDEIIINKNGKKKKLTNCVHRCIETKRKGCRKRRVMLSHDHLNATVDHTNNNNISGSHSRNDVAHNMPLSVDTFYVLLFCRSKLIKRICTSVNTHLNKILVIIAPVLLTPFCSRLSSHSFAYSRIKLWCVSGDNS